MQIITFDAGEETIMNIGVVTISNIDTLIVRAADVILDSNEKVE